MKTKALVIIAICLSVIILPFIRVDSNHHEEQSILEINGLETPSYTSLSLSESDPIPEGTSVTLTSTTTSMGMGVSSGKVDFKELELLKVENDTTAGKIYSNKFAIRINLDTSTEIQGFIVDITPTIREDVNFYIRTSLTGSDLRDGNISGYLGNSAHIDDQLLHIPFSFAGGLAPLTLDALTDYYFILESSSSTSDTFFELTES